MNDNASLASSTPRSALGGLPQRLVQDGVVEEAAMMDALSATKDGASIVTYLVKSGAAKARDIAIAASTEFGRRLTERSTTARWFDDDNR